MNRINSLSRWLLLIFLMGLVFSCAEKTIPEQELAKITKAINAIEDRKEAEDYIIKEETHILKVLESNYEQANSDGMREKISREISMKESVVIKAELNRKNQDLILDQLYAKRDSLQNLLSKPMK